MIPTRRHVDQISIKGREVEVSGWIFAPEDSPITGFRCEDAELLDVIYRDSPDVHKVYPTQEAAKKCRVSFLLNASIPRDGLLVKLTPTFATGVGSPWYVGLGLTTIPPEKLKRIGGDHGIGLEFLDHFVQYAGLTPQEYVLDFGCGCARIGIPVAKYLNPQSRYLGIDVMPDLIHWCQTALSRKDPRMTFIHSDAKNAAYHPNGAGASGVLPVAKESMTFSFAVSVFTHLRPAEAQQYLSELARVTIRGGTVFITAFLMDQYTVRNKALEFIKHDPMCWTTNPRVPEAAMGYLKETLLTWAEENRLQPKKILPGNWNGREDGYSFQDILIFEKVT